MVLAVPMAQAASGVGAPGLRSTEGTVLVPPAWCFVESRHRGVPIGRREPPLRRAAPGPAAPTPRPGSVASLPHRSGAFAARESRKGAGPPIGLILGGAALLFFMGLWPSWAGSPIGSSWLRSAEPTPAPVAEATPTAPPPELSLRTPAPAMTHGLLRVDSYAGRRRGCLVDGQEQQGTTPVEIPAVALGTHEVKVQLKGYEPSTETIALSVDAPTADLRFTLTKAQPTLGTVSVASTPAGAAIKVDGKPQGTTPKSGLRLRPGMHTVELALDGHDSWSGRVEVKAGEAARVRPSSRPSRNPSPCPRPRPRRQWIRTGSTRTTPGEVDVPAKRTSGSFAEWPRGVQQLRSNDSASVSVQFVVTESGEVQDPKVTESSGRPQVDESVLKAVRTFRYNPAQKQGMKVKVRVTFKQTFRAG